MYWQIWPGCFKIYRPSKMFTGPGLLAVVFHKPCLHLCLLSQNYQGSDKPLIDVMEVTCRPALDHVINKFYLTDNADNSISLHTARNSYDVGSTNLFNRDEEALLPREGRSQ